jgi:hypothetical protein
MENTVFRELDPFPSSGEGRETSILLGPLERANLNHWYRVNISLSSPDDVNRSISRNVVFSSIWNSGRWIKPRDPVILSAYLIRKSLSVSTAFIDKYF